MTQKDDTNWLPVTTEEMLDFLPTIYKAEELVALNLRGEHTEAVKLAAKIEFIHELRDLWEEQKRLAAEARAPDA